MFEGFRVNSIWPPNHVTYQLEINKLVKGCLGESMCVNFCLNLSSRSGEEDFFLIY